LQQLVIIAVIANQDRTEQEFAGFIRDQFFVDARRTIQQQ